MSDAADDARTEPPSERRIESFRRVGGVASSRELTAASVLAVCLLVLVLTGKSSAGRLAVYVRLAVTGAAAGQGPWQALRSGLGAMGEVLCLPVGMACAVALLVGLAQTRGNFAVRTFVADGSRSLPRLGNVLGHHTTVDLALELCKLGLLAAVSFSSIRPLLSVSAQAAGANAARLLSVLGTVTERLGLHLVLAMMGLGLADYLVQLARHQARLRQSRAEASRALREDEGAPELKAERRRLHGECLADNEEAILHAAELVLVDPGLAAIAISYSGQYDSAPRLSLWREHLLAHRLEAAARARGVPTFVDSGLVRTFAGVELGGEIPERSYLPVAELIARARKMRRSDGWTSAQSPRSAKTSSCPAGSSS